MYTTITRDDMSVGLNIDLQAMATSTFQRECDAWLANAEEFPRNTARLAGIEAGADHFHKPVVAELREMVCRLKACFAHHVGERLGSAKDSAVPAAAADLPPAARDLADAFVASVPRPDPTDDSVSPLMQQILDLPPATREACMVRARQAVVGELSGYAAFARATGYQTELIWMGMGVIMERATDFIADGARRKRLLGSNWTHGAAPAHAVSTINPGAALIPVGFVPTLDVTGVVDALLDKVGMNDAGHVRLHAELPGDALTRVHLTNWVTTSEIAMVGAWLPMLRNERTAAAYSHQTMTDSAGSPRSASREALRVAKVSQAAEALARVDAGIAQAESMVTAHDNAVAGAAQPAAAGFLSRWF